MGIIPDWSVGSRERRSSAASSETSESRFGPVPVEPGDVGEDHQLRGAERDREGPGRGIRVDVQRLTRRIDVGGDRRDHGDAAGLQLRQDAGRVDADDVADETQVDLDAVDHGAAAATTEEPRVLTRESGGEGAVLVDATDQVAGDLAGEHHADDVHGLGRRDPVSAAELARDAQALEHRRDLRSAAVHDDRMDAGHPEIDHVLGEGACELVAGHGIAAELHHDDPVRVALQPGQRLDERVGLGARLRDVVGLPVGLEGVGHEL